MPSPQETRLLKERSRQLHARGIVAELEITPGPKRQWYRADGVPMPNLLPADVYHIHIYEKKGWSMFPPANPKSVEDWKPRDLAEVPTPVLEVVEQPDVVEVVEQPDVVKVVAHHHTYRTNGNGVCRVAGCGHVRYSGKRAP